MKTYLMQIGLIACLLPTTAYSAYTCEAIFVSVPGSNTDLSRKYVEGLNEDHLFREGSVAAGGI